MSTEEWLSIPGWEGAYEVSSLGRVRSVERRTPAKGFTRLVPARILKLSFVRGYGRVTLQRDKSIWLQPVHRLVLLAFVGPCPDGMEGCHNDGDKQNNSLSNLRWDTKSANCQDRTAHGGSPNAMKVACPQGHPYSPENTRIDGGSRKCRTCLNRRATARKRRIRLALKEAS